MFIQFPSPRSTLPIAAMQAAVPWDSVLHEALMFVQHDEEFSAF
jgi:hypothetical protein